MVPWIVSCLLVASLASLASEASGAFAGGSPPGPPPAPKGERVETRCGWFSNPTPANASLYDRDGEWIVGVQSGFQAEGDWPDFKPGQWVETNVHYGYGCACLRLRVHGNTHDVLKIESSRARPLAACRRDRTLRRVGSKLGFK
jgi:hypothetical protein